jgi:hypothetical protein
VVTLQDITELPVRSLPTAENEVSRRYLRLMEQWVQVGVEHFAPWPERPTCGHFFGGCHWYGLETVGPALTFALLSTSPDYDAAAAGVSREALRQMAIQAVRYLCFTHDTGPPECVRPAVGLGRKENWGTKWGQRGEGFFRESQCGPTVAAIGLICLLLHDHPDLDDETWLMVARLHEDYGERFGDLPPRSGVYLDTQMEENYWTAHGLNAASLFLSRHERAAAWQAAARRWMFAACAAPQDAKNLGRLGETTVRALTGKTLTTLPDYWAENHGMVHPNYTAAGVRSLLTDGVLYQLHGYAPADLPPELFWNRRRIYENLKALTDASGYVQAVQGMDWHYLPAAGDEAPHAVAAVFFDDLEAATLQRLALRRTELRLAGNGGRLYNRDLALRAHDVQDPMLMREAYIGRVAEIYLLHRLMGPGAPPVPEEEVARRLMGVRHFPHAGFVHHRHERGQTSLSWRNSIMALPLTREGIFTIAPAAHSYLGHPVVAGHPESHNLQSVKVQEYDQSFAAALVIDRCQQTLRQEVLFASLPDGRALAFERFIALADVTVEALDQGFLRITNEHFPLLGSNCRGSRTLYGPHGAREYRGWLGESEREDVVEVYDHPAWLNVDDRLGLRFQGSGVTVYHNRHYLRPYHAIADDLTLSRLVQPKVVRRGEEVAHLAAALFPEQEHTATAAASFVVLEAAGGTAESVCLATAGFFAAAHFGSRAQVCTFEMARPGQVPVCAGATVQVEGERLHLRLRLEARSAAIIPVLRYVEAADGLQASAMPDGTIFLDKQKAAVTNPSGPEARPALNPPRRVGQLPSPRAEA